MDAEWIGFGTTIAAATLAFLFGRVNLARATQHEREEDLRRTRIEAYATFCSNIVEYRRAQLHRWFVGQDHGGPDAVELERPQVADDVRSSRAGAWSAFYRVLMICNDEDIVRQARATLEIAREMKNSTSAEELNAQSDLVHSAVEEFARLSGASVLAAQPRRLGPPREATKQG
jgi:hypothetical protein